VKSVKNKKKFKETKVGVFLKEKAPALLDTVGEFLPDQGGLGIVKNIITSDSKLEPKDKETALKLLDQDIQEMKDVSARWQSDMQSDSWLSKNTRPLTLIYLTLASTILIIIDSFHMMFDVDTAWVELLKTLLITVYVAYFGSRGAEKVFINKK
jgi:hypothetical protein|tara:strand:- start:576 stop:1037 length:462 start_codon:yes stop_codon:yes gene_type:complete